MKPGPEKQFDEEEALKQAMCAFWAKGYEATSMSELMKAMGIGKKSLYDTFGNKHELFLKSFQLFLRIEGKRIDSTLNQPGSPMQNLRSLLRYWEREHGKPGSHGCFIGTNIADFDILNSEVASMFRNALSGIESMFFDVLKRAQDAGELTDQASPRDLARMMICLMQGSAIVSRVQEKGTMQRSAFTAVLALLNNCN